MFVGVNVGFLALLIAVISAAVLLAAALREPQDRQSNGETAAA